MKITPINKVGGCRQGTLNVPFSEVENVLGFAANCKDDPYKVTHSWGFKVGKDECGIWDYKGDRILSCYGPDKVFVKLFGEKYTPARRY